MTEMFTRAEYLADKHSGAHKHYYGQFVTAETREHVKDRLGVERITAAFIADRHLNSIPLKEWDSVAAGLPHADIWDEVGDFATLAGMSCIAKEAAVQLLHPCFSGR